MCKSPLIPTAFFIGLILLTNPSDATAADFYVNGAIGDDTYAGNSWESALATITEAIRRSMPGDVIHVAESIYPENLVLKDQLTLLGGYATNGLERDWERYPCIIDGNQAGTCVVGADGALLEGFIVQNGRALAGAGILHPNISMTVRNALIRQCTATGTSPNGGGAMFLSNSNSTIDHCRIEDNRTEIPPESSGFEVLGGGIMMWTSSPRFTNTSFINNQIIDETNSRGLFGGAAWFIASQPVFQGCVFEGNQAMYGGGLGWWNHSIPSIEDCIFDGNQAVLGGGGICAIYSQNAENPERFTIEDCNLRNNTAQSGGAILVLRNCILRLDNCLISSNHAQMNGGGVSVQIGSDVEMLNCTVADNSITDSVSGDGSGVFCGDTAKLLVRHSIIAFNHGAPGVAYQGPQPSDLWVESCDVSGHSFGDYSSNAIDRSDMAENFAEDPRFVTGPDSAYYLSEPATGHSHEIEIGKSPCIDRGRLNTYGSKWTARTTRSDCESDFRDLDLGYHHFRPGPYLMPVNPKRDQQDVPVETAIYGHIRDHHADIDRESIEVFINGMLAEITITPSYQGYTFFHAPIQPFEHCQEVTVSVLAQNMEQPVRNLADGIYWFTTEGCPENPTPTPTPFHRDHSPELSFVSTSREFRSGDHVAIGYALYNPNFVPYPADLHIALEIVGEYFIYPVWDLQLHPIPFELPAGQTVREPIFDFDLPPALSPIDNILLYGILSESGTTEIIGDVVVFQFDLI